MKKEILKDNFSKKLLKKIKKERIKRIPKCVFIFKHLSVLFFLMISIIIWALSFSITFKYLLNADWDLVSRLWIIKIFTIFSPIFWLIFLWIATFLSYYNFRHTERWYKFNLFQILLINIISSLILWVIFIITWLDNFIEWKIEKTFPIYRNILVQDRVSRMKKVWQNEDKGLLLWEILNIKNNNYIELIDSNNKKWIIFIDYNTEIKHRVQLNTWEKIKIIWRKENDDTFKAKQIRPFMWSMWNMWKNIR